MCASPSPRRGQGSTALIGDTVRSMNQAQPQRRPARSPRSPSRRSSRRPVSSHFAGYPLKFKAKKMTTTIDSAKIHFQASPVGFWCMLESGAQAARDPTA